MAPQRHSLRRRGTRSGPHDQRQKDKDRGQEAQRPCRGHARHPLPAAATGQLPVIRSVQVSPGRTSPE
ncbi:hypothetical protein GCM10009589_28840 [Arthrobacter pascens]